MQWPMFPPMSTYVADFADEPLAPRHKRKMGVQWAIHPDDLRMPLETLSFAIRHMLALSVRS